ncbi:head GIN domain-containing protein [Pontibacter chitinilyticus]|uniref:head GIN domain-containing protein n=1 Tax=Pontibacter chitinilyticus TaxID=2674989 RepID=UPI00321BFCF0
MRLLQFPAALLLAGAVLSSCDEEGICLKGVGDVETRTLQLDAFHGVEVNGSTKVYVERGPTQKVEVKGQANILDELETDVDDGIWHIEFDRCLRKHKTVEVYITLPDLDYAEVSGSGLMSWQDTFDADNFQARVSGSGELTGPVAANQVTARISGSGAINLSGTAQDQDIAISGSGNLRAFGLQTKTTEVDVSGSGNAEVTTSDVLDVNISGSGRVYYQGNPTVNADISGSGKVIKK